jgi:hypothetical protein
MPYDALYFRRHRFFMPPLLILHIDSYAFAYFRLMPLFASAWRCCRAHTGAAIVDG